MSRGPPSSPGGSAANSGEGVPSTQQAVAIREECTSDSDSSFQSSTFHSEGDVASDPPGMQALNDEPKDMDTPASERTHPPFWLKLRHILA